jgi:hypothetical protein
MRFRLFNPKVTGAFEAVAATGTTILVSLFLWVVVVFPGDGFARLTPNVTKIVLCTDCVAADAGGYMYPPARGVFIAVADFFIVVDGVSTLCRPTFFCDGVLSVSFIGDKS